MEEQESYKKVLDESRIPKASVISYQPWKWLQLSKYPLQEKSVEDVHIIKHIFHQSVEFERKVSIQYL